MALCGTVPATAQEFTAADSGWVRLFNGVDFDGFYSRTYNVGGANAPLVTPPASPYTIEYAGTDTATIRVGTTANQGNIGTLDTTFSHYRVRWESKYDVVNNNSNSGMTYHVDESAIRMQNNWPRSIEFQGKQNEIGSAFSIQQVTFSTRVSSSGQGANYVPAGGTLVNACEIGCNGRWYRGNPLITPYASATPNETRWLRFHLVVRGADSAIHIVNDTTVFRLWNIRIFNDSTRATGSNNSGSTSRSNLTPNKPWDRGGLAWQAEGATVRYRRLEVMRIPPTTPMSAHYLHRLFLDSPTGPVQTPAISAVMIAIRWRSIGEISRVKLEYRKGTGGWNTISDSVPNTGRYDWHTTGDMPPNPPYEIRISSADYVWGDSTVGRPVTSLQRGGVLKEQPSYRNVTLHGGFLDLAPWAPYDRVEVRDASGGLVGVLPASTVSTRWERGDVEGGGVKPGFYFLRVGQAGRTLPALRVLIP